MNTKFKTTAKNLFIIYSIVMIWLLFGQRISYISFGSYFEQVLESYNLIPFYTVIQYIKALHLSGGYPFYFINLAGNIAMFIPLGFLLPAVWESIRTFWKTVVTATCTIICIETIQLFTLLGSWDIDDILLNVVGVIIGYLLFVFISKLIKR